MRRDSWPEPGPNPDLKGENDCEEMAKSDPRRLAALIGEAALYPWVLTFAAEHLGGHCRDSDIVVPALTGLLGYPKTYVQEGALLGLDQEPHNRDPRVGPALEEYVAWLRAEYPDTCLNGIAAEMLAEIRGEAND